MNGNRRSEWLQVFRRHEAVAVWMPLSAVTWAVVALILAPGNWGALGLSGVLGTSAGMVYSCLRP
jgi:hypothetical protein